MTHRIPAGLLAAHNSAIDKGATFAGLRMPHIALLLENAKRREDRVVSETRLARERCGDFPDGRRSFVPHDVHETEFAFGEVEGFFSRQERLHQLRN